MKHSFFQAVVVSILLYRCTTRTLTKQMEKKLDVNYTRILQAILNKSWKQHPTMQQLYGHLPPITKTIKIRQTRHVGHCWRNKDELISDVFLWTLSHGCASAGWQLEHTYSSSVQIRDVPLRTCRKQWTIGRSGERGSGISVLIARRDQFLSLKWTKKSKTNVIYGKIPTKITIIDAIISWYLLLLEVKGLLLYRRKRVFFVSGFQCEKNQF